VLKEKEVRLRKQGLLAGREEEPQLPVEKQLGMFISVNYELRELLEG
jgi:hypothetical protein